jgi:hypothetical protein
LLIRDSLAALRHFWGEEQVNSWLRESPYGQHLHSIGKEDLGRCGFPFLEDQLMEPTRPGAIEQMFREIGLELQRPVKTSLVGAGSLILQGVLNRRTQDLDLVDEVPMEIRDLGERLHAIERTHRLVLGHVQQRYLPSGWHNRVHSQAPFGQLQVSLVDRHDIFLSKLSSSREKDNQDLLVLAEILDKEALRRQFIQTCQSFLASDDLRHRMEKNWYILYGEPLPT